jgi:hypothetical protein
MNGKLFSGGQEGCAFIARRLQCAFLVGWLIIIAGSLNDVSGQESVDNNSSSALDEMLTPSITTEITVDPKVGDVIQMAQLSNVCITPVTYCFLRQPAPIGSPCWCPTPYGPSAGSVR